MKRSLFLFALFVFALYIYSVLDDTPQVNTQYSFYTKNDSINHISFKKDITHKPYVIDSSQAGGISTKALK